MLAPSGTTRSYQAPIELVHLHDFILYKTAQAPMAFLAQATESGTRASLLEE
jgi:hypothetical protein